MKNKKHPKLLKGLLFFIAGLAILMVVAYFVSIPLIEKKISSRLKALEPGIRVSYSSIHLQLFSGSIGFDSLAIRITPNPKEPQHTHSVYLQQFHCNGIHLLALLRGKEFIAESLNLGPANIQLDRFLLDKNQNLPPGIGSSQDIKFEKISIHRIESQDTKIWVDSATQNQFKMHSTLKLSDAEITGLKDSFSKQNVHLGSLSGTFSDLVFSIPGTLHQLRIKSIHLNSEKKSLSIHSLEVVPQYDKWEIAQKLGFQADYVKVSIPDIEIKNADWASLLNNKMKAEKITVGKANVYVFRDRRVARRSKIQSLPADLLNTLPLDIRIGSLQLNPSNIVYEEYPASGKQTGILKIENMRMSVTPLLNHPGKGDPQVLQSEMKGAIMGSGEVTASISMPLKPKVDYAVHGEFNGLELTTLNSAAENLGKIHIESGILNNLTFQFHFNNEKSSGQVIGEYHNLVIDKLRADEKHMGEKDRLKSFLVQKFVIRKNKDKSLPVAKRTGKIEYTRDPTRFISFYLLQSLLSGIRSSFTLGFVLPG